MSISFLDDSHAFPWRWHPISVNFVPSHFEANHKKSWFANMCAMKPATKRCKTLWELQIRASANVAAKPVLQRIYSYMNLALPVSGATMCAQ